MYTFKGATYHDNYDDGFRTEGLPLSEFTDDSPLDEYRHRDKYRWLEIEDESTGEIVYTYQRNPKKEWASETWNGWSLLTNTKVNNKKEENKMENTEERKVIGYCEECGNPIYEDDDYEEDDGKYFCRDCYDSSYCRCSDCGAIILCDDAIHVNPGRRDDDYVCEDCADNNYIRCSDCGEYFSSNHIWAEDGNRAICYDCSDNWYVCENCGAILDPDEVEWYDDAPYCCDCVPCRGHLHEYSHTYGERFYGVSQCGQDYTYTPGRGLFLGVELETDIKDEDRWDADTDSYVEDLYDISDDESLFVMKEDGSLNRGVEIVSQPATLEYHLNKFPWAKISEIARDHDYLSHNAGTCGLHVHVSCAALGETSTEQDLTKAKIALLFDRLWDSLVKFSRRTSLGWCGKLNADIKPEDTEQEAVNKAKWCAQGHRRALNMENRATLEYRIFRGTLNVNTIKATLEFVQNMTEFCIDHTLNECMDANWSDVAQYKMYPELETYLKERDLYVDTTDTIPAATVA